MQLHKLALGAAIATTLGFALPALAQNAAAPAEPAPDAALPFCSASVTDHCMQRQGHAPAAHAMHHGAKHHVKKRHHGGKHHNM